MVDGDGYRELGEAAWSWVLRHVGEDDGPWLPATVTGGADDAVPANDRDSLYAGIAGLAPALVEISRQRPWTATEADLAARIAARLKTQAGQRVEPSLYDGLAGDVTALRLLAPGTEAVALRRLAELATPAGWNTTMEIEPGSTAPVSDLVCGTAGVVMAAIWAGGGSDDEAARATADRIATIGGEALLSVADRTEAGLDWGMLPGSPSRGPNYSHGTAGIASALAIAGTALSRADFVEAAIEGARHLLAVGSLAEGGFIVPHTIPPSKREVEPLTYTWCHGPTGTSHLFAALRHAGVDEVGGHPVTALRRRCFHSVLTSGIPRRLRPGFWDNDGRCCGTAGVGDALLDAAQDDLDPDVLLAAARTMGDALVERAVRDDTGARWRFVEYRQDPPLLPPGTSWMQGAAGIAAFLLRLSRVLDGGPGVPVVDRPDQWWAVPASVRTVGPAAQA